MNKIITICSRFIIAFTFFLAFQSLWAQPGAMSVNQDVSGSYNNTAMTLKGAVFQARFQENATGTASGTRNWQFNSDGYNNTWGTFTSTKTLSNYNTTIIPNTTTASGNWVAAGYNAFGRLPATQANHYYTYNIIKGSSYASQNMSVLETDFNPVVLNSVAQTAGSFGSRVVAITTSVTPNTSENIFIRYSTNSFVNSTIVQATGSGTSWQATIPWQSGAVSFYIYSSNRTLSAINADVTSNGQSVHDTSMLNLNNNSGTNYSWTPVTGNFIVSSGAGTFAAGIGYSTLTVAGGAFAALNAAASGTGLVSILATGDSTSETGAISLNASTNWASVVLNPSGNRTISGASTDGNGLITFDGADNVTIDGVARAGANSLTITNTLSSATAGTATIAFLNDASNNTLQNCTVKGNGSGAPFTSTLSTAVVLFGNSTQTTGNDNNTITNNDITSEAISGYASQLVASYGTVGKLNSSNSVTNNNLYDFLNYSGMVAINLGINNDTWTITGNKIYQSISADDIIFSFQKGIVIQGGSGSYIVNNNIIGYANASSTGMLFGMGGKFTGIEVAVGATPATEMQGNTINNISCYGVAGSGNIGNATFNGIIVNSGLANIGTTTGNTIGAASGVGSSTNGIFILDNNSTVISEAYGISIISNQDCVIANNTIGAIKFDFGAETPAQFVFDGITVEGGGSFSIIKNAIGTTTSNSISIGTNVTNTDVIFNGIYAKSSTASTVTIGGSVANANIIQNINPNSKTITTYKIDVTGIKVTAAPNNLIVSHNVLRKFTFGATPIGNYFQNFTGILSSGNVSTSTKINNNAFGDATGNLIDYASLGSVTGKFKGIVVSGTTTPTIEIKDNDFRGVVQATASSSASNTHDFIELSNGTAANAVSTISGNTFTDLKLKTVASVNFIFSNYALASTGRLNINNNSVVTGFEKLTPSLDGVTFITSNGAAATGSIIEISGNNFSNIKLPLTLSNILIGIQAISFGTDVTRFINNNIFNNWESGLGFMTGISAIGFGLNSTINGNTISNFANKGTGASTIKGIDFGGSSFNGLNVQNNTISGLSTLSTATTSTLKGIHFSAAVSGVLNISSNNISGFSNRGTATLTTDGIEITNPTTFAFNVFNNSISGFSAFGTGTTSTSNGISVGSNHTLLNIFKNKIYDFTDSSTGAIPTLNGINITNGTDVNVYNNLIGNLFAPNASNGLISSVIGLNVNSTRANSAIKVSNNTVLLTGTSSGTNFSTTGVFHTTNATATTANLTLINNIIINKSIPKGTGIATAYRRSTSVLNNFNAASNNNLMFAGVPSANNLIFYNGTNSDQTLTDYQGRVTPRELNSFTEDVAFISTAGASADFLRPVASNTLVEGNGKPIAGITDDFLGTTRNVSTPDIGAYEIAATPIPAPVVVSGALVGNGNYANLSTAFAQINIGAQTAQSVVVTVNSNVNEGIQTAVLNGNDWTTLRVVPGATAVTVSGITTAGFALVAFDGADNVTVDGNISGTNSLTFSNSRVAATARTSTIRFVNDAKFNTIKNCTIEGSSALINSGTVYFEQGNLSGNTNNTVESNLIKPAGSNLPFNAIYSNGVDTTNNNAANTIQSNTIQDYFNPTGISSGIYLFGFSERWTINNNTIQQTASRTFTTASTARGIYNLTLERCTISNNTIGGSTTAYSGPTTSSFTGIHIEGGTDNNITNVLQNTIAGINLTTNTGKFVGIDVLGGSSVVDLNSIGSVSATGSINVINGTTPAAGVANFYGIKYNSTGTTSLIRTNSIGGISLDGNANSVGSTLYGIYFEGNAKLQCTNNVIGSTTVANSIVCGKLATTATCIIQSIRNLSTGITVPVSQTNHEITSNTIANNTVFGSTANSLFYGINNVDGNEFISISLNTLTDIKIHSRGTSQGIVNQANGTTNQIQLNTIKKITIENILTNFIGIQNTGNASPDVFLSGNKFGTTTENFIIYNVANSGTLTCVLNSGNSTGQITIKGNTIQKINHAISGSTAHTYIQNDGIANAILNIEDNIFSAINVATSGLIQFIRNDVSLPEFSTYSTFNNEIVTSFNKSVAGGGIYLYYTNAVSHPNSSLNLISNKFLNITVTGSTPIFGCYINDTGLNYKGLSFNEFKNWTGGTASIKAIDVNGMGGGISDFINGPFAPLLESDITSNIINNISGASTIYGIDIQSLGNATASQIIVNTITGLSSTGGSIIGIVNRNASPGISLIENTINNLSTSASPGHVSAITITDSSGITNVIRNKISNIHNSGIGVIATTTGIHVVNTAGTTNIVNIEGNEISNLRQTTNNSNSRLYGIWLENGNDITAFNNFISDLRAPLCNNSNAITGIGVTSTNVNTNYKLYFNTIHINATSTGTNFGADCVFHNSNATATTANLTMINNIFVNTSTPNGTGLALCVRKNGTALNNFNAASNNNLYYVGTPNANKLLYNDGANSAQNIAQLTAITTPRETNSFYNQPYFVDVATNDLHLISSGNCNISNLGKPIAGFTSDIDLNSRNATTPDVGADEFANNFNLTVSNPANGCTRSLSSSIVFPTSINPIRQFSYWHDLAATLPVLTPNNVPSGTYYIKMVSGSCSDIKAVSFTNVTSTYTTAGGWSSTPDISKDLIINDDLNISTTIDGCVCRVNTGKNVIVQPTGVLNLKNRLVVNGTGTFYVQNNASLVQIDNDAINVGSIKADRTTSTYENFDYVYWSSPVLNAPINAPFATWRLNRAYQYITSNFSDLFSGAYNPSTGFQTIPGSDSYDDNGDDWATVSGSTIMSPAKGYIVLTPFTAVPTTTNVSFNGVPNNGFYTIPLSLSANTLNNNDDFNLVGNPYPSALDADAFITANIFEGNDTSNNISGTIYLWTHVGNVAPVATNPGPEANNFNGNDYATYTLAGGVGVGSGSGTGSTIPSGKIASGQAFFVDAEVETGLIFANNMRSSNFNNSQFFRSNNSNSTDNNSTENNVQKDRLRLNFKNVDNMFSQQLIGYFANATSNFDYGYDGIVSQTQNYVSFYSLMNNNPNLYRIQAKSSWNVNDSVSLGYSSAVSGSSSISIGTLEGVFNLSTTNVYLQDNLLNITHNLKLSPYNFTTAVGTFNNRFVLKYVSTTLGLDDSNDFENTVIVAKKQAQLILKSAFLPIQKVSVFDMLGRNVFENNKISKNEFIIDNVVLNQQTLIVKITLENGTVVTRKVVF